MKQNMTSLVYKKHAIFVLLIICTVVGSCVILIQKFHTEIDLPSRDATGRKIESIVRPVRVLDFLKIIGVENEDSVYRSGSNYIDEESSLGGTRCQLYDAHQIQVGLFIWIWGEEHAPFSVEDEKNGFFVRAVEYGPRNSPNNRICYEFLNGRFHRK